MYCLFVQHLARAQQQIHPPERCTGWADVDLETFNPACLDGLRQIFSDARGVQPHALASVATYYVYNVHNPTLHRKARLTFLEVFFAFEGLAFLKLRKKPFFTV